MSYTVATNHGPTSGTLGVSTLGMIGRSSALQRIREEVEMVAQTDATVLIHGETGTGKELVAAAIHKRSGRTGAFVKLNCAAVPPSLLESELMGHEKGAFTGALARRVGRFEAAQHGTVFLDEIGEMPLDMQPKLLRILQEREFERLGSNQTIRTDARLVAATNRDLRGAASERRLREDLFYRLNVFPIKLPALRDRREDIPDLINHFVDAFARRTKRHLDPVPSEFLSRLCAHDWPGNIRELKNVVERAAILAYGGAWQGLHGYFEPVLSPEETHGDSPTSHRLIPAKSHLPDGSAATSDRLEDVQRRHILAVLKATNWMLGGPRGAATRLGLKRTTLIYRMKQLRIDRRPIQAREYDGEVHADALGLKSAVGHPGTGADAPGPRFALRDDSPSR
jgi:transcriptional regulator with GAF, ATPase, and Fis domain